MKILVVGDPNAGKTALCRRYSEGQFTQGYKATVGVDMHVRGNVVLWDVAGQERFSNLTTVYYRGAHGALLVLDWNRSDAVDRALLWIEDMKGKMDTMPPIVLVAHKADLPSLVTMEDLDSACKGNECIVGWFSVSSKTGQGVEEAIHQLLSSVQATQEEAKEREIIRLTEEYENDPENLCCP